MCLVHRRASFRDWLHCPARAGAPLHATHAARPRTAARTGGSVAGALSSSTSEGGMEGDQPGFGVLLRRYRMATGLTQEALAERAGLSLRGVSDLERGLRRVPYPNTVERLSEALRLGAIDRAALQAAGRPGHPGVQNESASLPPRSALPG